MLTLCNQEQFNNLSNVEKIKKGVEVTRKLIADSLEDCSSTIIISDDLLSFTLLSMEVSPFPTESRKVMKFIETKQLNKFIDKYEFVEVDNYCVIFANQEDLSYHNFENILNLDDLFKDVHFNITSKKLIKQKEAQIQIFNMEGSTQTLLSLDKLNYYTRPLNNSQRGGRRLIFHSNQLSIALTQMITKSKFFDKKDFSHVNTVFRLNNFAPGDKKFKVHYDTPYADKSKNLYSKYTMLIYLIGNSNNQNEDSPPLKIEDYVVKSINKNDCIIFDQKCQHEGNAYTDTNKIFIRTELIYKIENHYYDDRIARMFNMACYMTKEPGQQDYSADLFNKCVKMRYGVKDEIISKVYLLKKHLDTLYVTDGNYYWFSSRYDLKSIAVLIILDYFNGKINDLKKVDIQTKTFPKKNPLDTEEEISEEDISTFLSQYLFPRDKIKESSIKSYQALEDFIPDKLCDDFPVIECECGLGEDVSAMEYFSQSKNIAAKKLMRILNENSVMIFDKMITISYDKIVIQQDDQEISEQQSGKIRLSDFYINPDKKINFASAVCQCDEEYEFEDVMFYKTKKVVTFCLPDISYQVLPSGVIKLSIDIFNNGFVYCVPEAFQQPFTDEEKTIKKLKFAKKGKQYEDSDESSSQQNEEDSEINESEESIDSNEDEEEEEDDDDDNDNQSSKNKERVYDKESKEESNDENSSSIYEEESNRSSDNSSIKSVNENNNNNNNSNQIINDPNQTFGPQSDSAQKKRIPTENLQSLSFTKLKKIIE